MSAPATTPTGAAEVLDRFRRAAGLMEILARRAQPRVVTWRLTPADHLALIGELKELTGQVAKVIAREAAAGKCHRRRPYRGADDLATTILGAGQSCDSAAERLGEALAEVTGEVSVLRAAGHPGGQCAVRTPTVTAAARRARAAIEGLAGAPQRPGLTGADRLQIVSLIQAILCDLGCVLGFETTLADAALETAGCGASRVLALLHAASREAELAALPLGPVHCVLQAAADAGEEDLW